MKNIFTAFLLKIFSSCQALRCITEGQSEGTARCHSCYLQRARKEVLKRKGHKPCWSLILTTGVIVVLIHSIAFYAVFLGNMVSAVFREIHTEKCKKTCLFFSFIFSCSWKRCKTPYFPQPTLLKMLQESTPEPSLKSSLGPLSAKKQAFCLI